MAKISKFNKKNISSTAFFFFLYFLSWCSPSFAEFSEYFSSGLTDRECGTLKDPNYRAAFFALQEAIEFCFQRPLKNGSREPYFFP